MSRRSKPLRLLLAALLGWLVAMILFYVAEYFSGK